MVIEKVFDKSGYFVNKSFDPYREPEHWIYPLLFEENGRIKDSIIAEICSTRTCHYTPFCDLIKLMYGYHMEVITKGNYTAIYMWRH